MKQLLILFLSFFLSLGLQAQENNDALINKGINAFNQKDYTQSVQIFKELVKVDSLNATLHYNLGTAYLRLQNTGLSIYHLEKSLKLNPDYEPARINLNFAEKLKTTVSKGNLPVPQQQMLYSVFNFLTPNTWAYLAIGAMIFTVVLLIAYRFSQNAMFKKIFFSSSILLLVVSILSFTISKNQSKFILSKHYVIVKEKAVKLMEEPRAIAKITSTLNEGEKAFIKEETERWIKIQLPNDTIGWVEKNKVLQY